MSRDTYVWYYHCGRCGHAWSISKTDETVVQHVTPVRKWVTHQLQSE
jgi:hypothetical protein